MLRVHSRYERKLQDLPIQNKKAKLKVERNTPTVKACTEAKKTLISRLNQARKSRFLVGMTRFELAAPWSQTRCATKLRHIPLLFNFQIIAA